MEFRLLRTFDVVAAFLNFNRAAAVLHCTQSTISAQIKALEEDLGTRVFERLGRRVVLTAAGKELQRHTRRLLSYEDEIRSGVRKHGESVGLISLRAPQSVADLYLPALLNRFHQAYPRVGFDISNCGYFHLSDELRSGTIDAGFLLTLSIDSADLHTSVVLTEPMAFVVNPESPLANRSHLTFRDLAGQTLLLPKHDCAYRMELEHTLRRSRIETSALIELNSVRAIVQCLKQGLGVAFLPRNAVAHELASGELKQLDWRTPLKAELYLIRHRDKPLTGIHGAFIAMAEGFFAEQRLLRGDGPRPKHRRVVREGAYPTRM